MHCRQRIHLNLHHILAGSCAQILRIRVRLHSDTSRTRCGLLPCKCPLPSRCLGSSVLPPEPQYRSINVLLWAYILKAASTASAWKLGILHQGFVCSLSAKAFCAPSLTFVIFQIDTLCQIHIRKFSLVADVHLSCFQFFRHNDSLRLACLQRTAGIPDIRMESSPCAVFSLLLLPAAHMVATGFTIHSGMEYLCSMLFHRILGSGNVYSLCYGKYYAATH